MCRDTYQDDKRMKYVREGLDQLALSSSLDQFNSDHVFREGQIDGLT